MLKELNEKRVEIINKMEDLLNTAKAENRALTEEESAIFNASKEEAEEITNKINLEEKEYSDMREFKNLKVEDVEVKQFANTIRGIVNADNPTTVTTAGAIIPTKIWGEIITKVEELAPVFERATKIYEKGNIVLPKVDYANTDISMEWVTEGSAGTDSKKLTLTSIELNGYLARVLCKVSISLINSTDYDIVGFVIDEMAKYIAGFMNNILINGAVSPAIEGLTGIPVGQTVTGAKATKLDSDDIIEVQDKVPDDFKTNAIWIMHPNTRTALRKLKDGQGNYLLERDFTARWGYRLLGNDVYCSSYAPQLGANNKAIIYGDISGLAVHVVEEPNIRRLDERFAEEHQIGLLAFMEIDAKVQNEQKLAQLKCGASD